MNLIELNQWAKSANTERKKFVAQELTYRVLSFRAGSPQRLQSEAALMLMLDDTDPGIRLVIARVLGESDLAPRAVIKILLDDEPEISQYVFQYSPVVYEQELLDAARRKNPELNHALASRATVSEGLCWELIRLENRNIAIALLSNEGADLTTSVVAKMAWIFATDAEIRTLLLERIDLPIAEIHNLLLEEINWELSDRTDTRDPRFEFEDEREVASEEVTVALAYSADISDLNALVEHLCERNYITPTLLIRAALTGNTAFVCRIIAQLAEVKPLRVEALVSSNRWNSLHNTLSRIDMPAAVASTLVTSLQVVTSAFGSVEASVPSDTMIRDSYFSAEEQSQLLSEIIENLEELPEDEQATIPLLNRLRANLTRQAYQLMYGRSDAA